MAHADKALKQSMHFKRRMTVFMRTFTYGLDNFRRNAWLTVAATVVMTITLLLMFITFAAQNILSTTAIDIGKRIDRSIYLRSETTEDQASVIMNGLRSLANVEEVSFVSAEEGREIFAKENKHDAVTLNAISEATNKIPAKISITLKKVDDTEELISFVNNSQALKEYIDPIRKPTFISDRRAATETIANWTSTAQQFGVMLSIVFATISILIVFNTIRMAIFNRKDEIEMMKLVGANAGFIRGPFVVEAIIYGMIAAALASGAGYAILYATKDSLEDYGIAINSVVIFMQENSIIIVAGMFVAGMLIGVISALLATRRYLKI